MFGANWIKTRIIFYINNFIIKLKIINFMLKNLANILLREIFFVKQKFNILLKT